MYIPNEKIITLDGDTVNLIVYLVLKSKAQMYDL